ncbi:MAG TPA: DUF1634 domain-containing protein [Steroidobacteraceae bacterium]|jgi:uncharacterized membrane protein|nr:DUF1634 domain-containing protein [Steroidobacteraceae bacterium]
MTEPSRKPTPTAKPRREPTREEDQRLEVAIAALLRVGVIAAAVLVAIGGVLLLRHPGAPVPDYRIFHAPGESSSTVSAGASIHSIAAVFRHLRSGSGPSIIALGLLLLIATPIARVVFAVVGFARERDALYTVISLIVLAILAFSLVHGG